MLSFTPARKSPKHTTFEPFFLAPWKWLSEGDAKRHRDNFFFTPTATLWHPGTCSQKQLLAYKPTQNGKKHMTLEPFFLAPIKCLGSASTICHARKKNFKPWEDPPAGHKGHRGPVPHHFLGEAPPWGLGRGALKLGRGGLGLGRRGLDTMEGFQMK